MRGAEVFGRGEVLYAGLHVTIRLRLVQLTAEYESGCGGGQEVS